MVTTYSVIDFNMKYLVYIFDKELQKPVKVLETTSHLDALIKKKHLQEEGELTFIDYEEESK